MSSPTPPERGFRPRWSQSLFGSPRGLTLAREKGWLLGWDDKNWLYLLNRNGERQAQATMPGTLTAACCADDGSACVAVSQGGEVRWLAPDLTVRWSVALAGQAVAVAVDPFGQYAAIASQNSGLMIFDRTGKKISEVQTPRPLHHLRFVPEQPFLVGAADFGLIACYDLTGACKWREGLVVHCGSLSTTADGANIVLACFSDGLRGYTADGKSLGRLPFGEPARFADWSLDGHFLLLADLQEGLVLFDADGTVVGSHRLEGPPIGIVLGPLGDYAAAALADGRIVAFDLRGAT